jgi:hypothetical protein
MGMLVATAWKMLLLTIQNGLGSMEFLVIGFPIHGRYQLLMLG